VALGPEQRHTLDPRLGQRLRLERLRQWHTQQSLADAAGILPRLGIGLTDVVKRKAGTDDELGTGDFDVEGFTSRIAFHAPRVVCFNGKKAGKIVLGRERIEYGIQPERIGDSLVFVAPSTSGSARGYWDIRHWRDVAELSREPE
jgi:TDG/mug DNA glycosylase family protein